MLNLFLRISLDSTGEIDVTFSYIGIRNFFGKMEFFKCLCKFLKCFCKLFIGNK